MIELLDAETETPQSNIKNKPNWFKMGLLFATGEMDILHENYKSGSAIARHLMPNNASSITSIINLSWGNGDNINNNIFSRPNKLNEIADYCGENNLEIAPTFKDKIKYTIEKRSWLKK